MTRPTPRRAAGLRSAVLMLAAAVGGAGGLLAAGLALTGCDAIVPAAAPTTRYGTLPSAVLPAFMQGTVEERALITPDSQQPLGVSGYGLVGQLRGTGDSTAANVVRQYMIKELSRHGFGAPGATGYHRMQPAEVLKSPAYAVVRVDAFIPPGARRDDWTDAQVSCLPKNLTSSLSHGVLFETDLQTNGADMDAPRQAINVAVRTKGAVAVNPAYALDNPAAATPAGKASLRSGTVMLGARVLHDRPLLVQLRNPQHSVSRRIEDVVRQRFQDETVARALDEGVVELYVPKAYRGDWQRFAEVCRHLYVNTDTGFQVGRAKQLAAEAVRPNARLEDISYCWEGIGPAALPQALPLMAHADPRVAYFAARAAACIGDPTGAAEQRLMYMAETPDHPFQLTALRTLGGLQGNTSLNHLLRKLLNADQASVRVEAYQILARNRDAAVVSTAVAPATDPTNQRFTLDRVPSDGPPLVYVTRNGAPRIALIGRTPDLNLGAPFLAMEDRLTIANDPRGRRQLVLYFRPPMWLSARPDAAAGSASAGDLRPGDPVKVASQPELDTVIARLGGMGAIDEDRLDFSYAEVVAILQGLVSNKKLIARDPGGRLSVASFRMQEPDRVREDLARAAIVGAYGATAGEAPQFGPAVSPAAAAKPTAMLNPAEATGPAASDAPTARPATQSSPAQPVPVGGSSAPQF